MTFMVINKNIVKAWWERPLQGDTNEQTSNFKIMLIFKSSNFAIQI